MNMLQLLTIILPIIALFCVLTIACVNVFLAIRKHYPIKVNCWFCNNYSQVNYEDRNSFYCSSCQQYNGFNEDGHYNKLIPEQHDEMLNTLPSVRQVTGKASNGLCRFCNNNQQLKIYQLASFVPLNESAYDIEIQHFKNLLEKAYKLCPKCEHVLHRTLSDQNKQLIGQRILSMHKKSMEFLNINKSSKHVTTQQKKVFFNFLLYFTLILISILLLNQSIQNKNLSERNIKRKLPEYLHSYISEISRYLTRVSQFNKYYIDSVNKIHEVQEICNYLNNTFTPVKIMIKDRLSMKIPQNQYLDYLIANTSRSVLNRVQDSFYEIALIFCALFLQLCTFLLRKHNVYTTILWIFLLLSPYVPLDAFMVSIAKVFILTTVLYKTLKNTRLKSTSKYNQLLNKSSESYSDSSAELSNFSQSSSSDLSASTNYFNTSNVGNTSFQSLNSCAAPRKTKKTINSNINRINGTTMSIFGAKAVLSNSLLKSQSDMSFHNKNFDTNSIKSFVKDVTDLNNANDILSGIMNLSLGKRNATMCKPNHQTTNSNSNIFRTKPILSPPSFVYNNYNNKRPTSTSWCTDNWLKQDEFPFSSRCSSQTSGFVSLVPNELNTSQNSLSLPDSANSSICGDLDRASVISEPIGAHANFGSSVFSTKSGSNLNHSTASNFSKIMNRNKLNNKRYEGNNSVNCRGLFKPIVFNSDELSNSDLND